MQAFVNAFLKDKPFFFKREYPGRLFLAQPLGKWVMWRSWSVKNKMTFLPLKSSGLKAVKSKDEGELLYDNKDGR